MVLGPPAETPGALLAGYALTGRLQVHQPLQVNAPRQNVWRVNHLPEARVTRSQRVVAAKEV
jgi:hypothetical protein